MQVCIELDANVQFSTRIKYKRQEKQHHDTMRLHFALSEVAIMILSCECECK